MATGRLVQARLAAAPRLRAAVPLALLAAAALFPLVAGAFHLELAAKVMILAIFALSLDLLVGHTGLVSFGHAAFYGLGAYSLALLSPKYEAASLWLTLPAAMLAAGAAALVIGALALRTRGVYFIMVTLAFAQMVYFVFHDTRAGGGSDGVYVNVRPEATLGGGPLFDLADGLHAYYFVLAALAATVILLRLVLRSPFGHALHGIRANEHRMRALGFPVYRYKLASFTLAGALAGLAGYLNALQFGFVNPELLSWHESGNALLMVILGGMGSVYGVIGGAAAFALLQEGFSALTRHWQLPLGLAIVALVLFMPGGMAGFAARLRAGRARRDD